MKRLILILSSVLLLSACDQNEPKMFERGDANVYFDESSIGTAVGNILSIPVTVANLPGGPAITVDFTITDSTAVEGVDYKILSGNSCIFESGHGTEYIVIETYAREEDSLSRRLFDITLEPVEGFRQNNRNTSQVELRNYSNHPLKNLLGDAEMSGLDYMAGNEVSTFPVNIYPDDDDDLTLYLSGVTGGPTYLGMLPDLKMTVDTVLNEIYIVAETLSDVKVGSTTGSIEIVRGFLVDNLVYYETNSLVSCTYTDAGNIYFDDWLGAIWATGSEEDNFLFFYYGYYASAYRTAIIKED
ncbi:MAG: hypothetical protein ACK5MI_00770 [Mangrovibacterium sp.]